LISFVLYVLEAVKPSDGMLKDSWYNLVLLSDAAVREHVKGSTTHAYAAYQLAPLYYEWVRLHHGILPNGLAQGDMQLLSTKYYTFHVRPYKPIILERSYEVYDISSPPS